MPVTRINEFHAAPGREAALRAFLILEAWTDIAAHQAAASQVPPDMYAALKELIAEPPRGRYYASPA